MSVQFAAPEHPERYRAGFACIVGRPNAGKSTLVNALVGTKVAITSGRPQTTRHTIRGIVHRPEAQLVLVDTPGLHRPRTLLGTDGARLHFFYSEGKLYFQKNLSDEHHFVSASITLPDEWTLISGQWGDGYISIYISYAIRNFTSIF